MVDQVIWVGILFCITQSAIFSGLNLAFFSLNRLRLELESEQGSVAAMNVLALRKDSNFLLTTILWGNVAINVLLTLLSNSVMFGLSAFLFSTIAITFLGEIAPQAYFSRHALRMASLLMPIIKMYQFILYPVAKPSAYLLDLWLGKEGVEYLKERDLTSLIRAHVEAKSSEVEKAEGIGAINFFALDDIDVSHEGMLINENSIIALPSKLDFPIIPEFKRMVSDSFLMKLNSSGQSWVVLTNEQGEPLLALDANGLLRDAVFETGKEIDPYGYCHRPIITRSKDAKLGELIIQYQFGSQNKKAGVINEDVILLWGEEKRIITGTDLLGRLLKGVAKASDSSVS